MIVKNCPVCKATTTKKGNCRVKLSSKFEQKIGNYFVYCDNCGLKGPNGVDMEQAIKLWNGLKSELTLIIDTKKSVFSQKIIKG